MSGVVPRVRGDGRGRAGTVHPTGLADSVPMVKERRLLGISRAAAREGGDGQTSRSRSSAARRSTGGAGVGDGEYEDDAEGRSRPRRIT